MQEYSLSGSIPLEHGAYTLLSRPFLDFFIGGPGYTELFLHAVQLHVVRHAGGGNNVYLCMKILSALDAY